MYSQGNSTTPPIEVFMSAFLPSYSDGNSIVRTSLSLFIQIDIPESNHCQIHSSKSVPMGSTWIHWHQCLVGWTTDVIAQIAMYDLIVHQSSVT